MGGLRASDRVGIVVNGEHGHERGNPSAPSGSKLPGGRCLTVVGTEGVTCPWAVLYIKRWLPAPMIMEDGMRVERTRGTPQGGVVSPVLANLFLHYAFDL